MHGHRGQRTPLLNRKGLRRNDPLANGEPNDFQLGDVVLAANVSYMRVVSLAKPEAGKLIIGTIALLTASTSSEDPVVGGNTYMTYLITTWTNIPDLNGTEFSLRRRFKDFVTLSDRLSDSYREFFFPMRPDKSVVGKQVTQKQGFVEQRTMAFNKYLKKLAAHPVIRTSEDLRVFLQAQGNLPLAKTTTVASRMMSPPRGENLDSSISIRGIFIVLGRKESWFSSIKKTLSRSSKEKKTQKSERKGFVEENPSA
ncbi:hypothetical protein L1887_07300 [Cichorium endivia]|nr:hypothetical protein L1887_07300 [Cichorium endivia]